MSFEDRSIKARLVEYAQSQGIEYIERLGFGKDGEVYSTNRFSAVKVFERDRTFERELAIYGRLAKHGMTSIHGSAIPELTIADETLGVLEMSIVAPPFVLDFATAELDAATQFPEEVMNEWWEQKRDEFGDCWPRVVGILRALQKLGIYMTDVHPGNIRFPEMDSMPRRAGSSSSSGSS